MSPRPFESAFVAFGKVASYVPLPDDRIIRQLTELVNYTLRAVASERHGRYAIALTVRFVYASSVWCRPGAMVNCARDRVFLLCRRVSADLINFKVTDVPGACPVFLAVV